jgi:hypothetical protein
MRLRFECEYLQIEKEELHILTNPESWIVGVRSGEEHQHEGGK